MRVQGGNATRSFRLVVGLKTTDGGAHAIEEAARIARRIPGCTMHLVHAMEERGTSPRMVRDRADHLRLYVDEKVASLGGLASVGIGLHVRVGDPASAIVEVAREVGADLVVLGPSDHRVFHAGRDAERVATATPCPVLVATHARAARAQPEPVIEPPCPDCVRARVASHGAAWWCARHEHRIRPHAYSYRREHPLATHDSEVIPTGISM
jgi:nucleotide-binding universal stress UspA family protein